MIVLNGEILTNVLNFKVNHELGEIGKIKGSRATITIDNSNAEYKYNPVTNKLEKNGVEITKDLEISIEFEGKRLFTGWTDKPVLNSKGQVKIQAHDWVNILQDKILDEKMYIDMKLVDIIKDILPNEIDTTKIQDINLVIDNYRIKKNTKMIKALETLIASVGGKFWFDEYNRAVFDGGYIYMQTHFDTTTIDTINISNSSDLKIKNQNKIVEKVILTSKALKKVDDLKYIYINVNFDVETNPYPTTGNSFKADFDNSVWYVDSYNNIEFQSDDGVTLDQTTYNSNFLTGNTPKNPDTFELKFLNGGAGKKVNYLKIKGKEFVENTYIAEYGSTDTKAFEKEVKTDLVQSNQWANDLTQYYYREFHNRPQVNIKLSNVANFFSKDYNLNKKVILFFEREGVSNRCVIEKQTINVKEKDITIRLELKYDAGTSFVPETETTTEISKNIGSVSTIEKQLQDIADDNKVTPEEKKQLQKIYDSIVSEKSIIDNTADHYGISKTNYDTAYNALITYLNGLNLTNMTTKNITRSDFNTNFKNYYDERTKIYERVSYKSDLRIEGVESTLNDISADDKLTPVEKQQVKQIWDRIQDEYEPTKTTATNYGLSYDNYETAYNTLNSYVPNLLTDMTTTSTIDRTTFNNNFNNYYAELKNILDNTDIKTEQPLDDKIISYGTDNFKIGKSALPDDSNGIWINDGKLLIGASTTASKRLYYDGTNLELIGGSLKLSSTEGEINFLDSGIILTDSGEGSTNHYEISFNHSHSTQQYLKLNFDFNYIDGSNSSIDYVFYNSLNNSLNEIGRISATQTSSYSNLQMISNGNVELSTNSFGGSVNIISKGTGAINILANMDPNLEEDIVISSYDGQINMSDSDSLLLPSYTTAPTAIGGDGSLYFDTSDSEVKIKISNHWYELARITEDNELILPERANLTSGADGLLTVYNGHLYFGQGGGWTQIV